MRVEQEDAEEGVAQGFVVEAVDDRAADFLFGMGRRDSRAQTEERGLAECEAILPALGEGAGTARSGGRPGLRRTGNYMVRLPGEAMSGGGGVKRAAVAVRRVLVGHLLGACRALGRGSPPGAAVPQRATSFHGTGALHRRALWRTPILDIPWLIRTKRAAGRPRDLEVIAELQALEEEAAG